MDVDTLVPVHWSVGDLVRKNWVFYCLRPTSKGDQDYEILRQVFTQFDSPFRLLSIFYNRVVISFIFSLWFYLVTFVDILGLQLNLYLELIHGVNPFYLNRATKSFNT